MSGLTLRRSFEKYNYPRAAPGHWSRKISSENKGSKLVEVPTGRNSSPKSSEGTIELWAGECYRLGLAEGFSTDAVKELLDIVERR